MTISDKPVLIVGAGPTGLIVGIELARRGVPFHLIDRMASPAPWSAAIFIKSRSLEILAALGLIDDLMDFLSSRVPINHNARVVMYLRELGVVSEEEADEILAASTPNRSRRGGEDRLTVKLSWALNAALLLAVIGGGGAIQAAAGGLDDNPLFGSEAHVEVSPQRAGFLRFIVHPWAEVHIDGQHVLTTPSARRVALSPGEHHVELRNEYYPAVSQQIVVVEGETHVIEESLEEGEDLAEPAADAGAEAP